MGTGKIFLTKWQLICIVLAGTITRFIYGYSSSAWFGAPDQLAWGLRIDEVVQSRTWTYFQLIHAPHEGGSFFISIFSLLFRPLQCILPSLSFAALAIDTTARFIQIRIVQKLFDDETACWFGVWTILSVPLLIPWATVNFGLHSLFSFIPFVFFYFTNTYENNNYLPVICALISGIAISLSYDSLILPIVSIIFLLSMNYGLKKKILNIIVFVSIFIVILSPHLLTRFYLHTGSDLATDPVFSIRGVPLGNLFTYTHLTNLCSVWFTSLPGSFLLSVITIFSAKILCAIVCLFIFVGFVLYLLNPSKRKSSKLLAICIIFLFIAMYAFSPFYEKAFDNKSYVYYRHLCYIVPFITMILIAGFIRSGKWKLYLLASWILLGSAASSQYIWATRKIDQPVYRAAGWILANKYGSNVDKLLQIHAIANVQYQDELLVGFGWGLSAAIFGNNNDPDSIEKLVRVVKQYPDKYQPVIIRGVYYSFSKGISPVLDQQLLTKLNVRLSEERF